MTVFSITFEHSYLEIADFKLISNVQIIHINCFVIIECYSGWLTLFIGILVNLCPQLPLLRFIFS